MSLKRPDAASVKSLIKRLKAPIWCTLLAVAGCLVVFIGWWNGPQRIERDFVSALQGKDWGRLYDLTPSQQLAEHGVGREAFVTLMNTLTEGLPDDTFSEVRLEPYPVRGAAYDGVFLTLPHAIMADGKPLEQAMAATKTRTGWTLPVAEFPLKVNKIRPGDCRQRWARMAKAMKVAGIESYTVTLFGLVLVRERAERAGNGTLDCNDVYSINGS